MTTAELSAPSTSTPIVITQYEKLRTDIAILQDEDKKAVFQYRDPKGNKLARSHLFKLRTAKGDVERARKGAKADALEYGRRVDAVAKDLESQIEALIKPHQAAIEAREAKLAAQIKADRERREREAAESEARRAALAEAEAKNRAAVVARIATDLSELKKAGKIGSMTALAECIVSGGLRGVRVDWEV